VSAKTQARIEAAELRAIRQLSDEELAAAIAAYGPEFDWVELCTDAELESMLAGGAMPTRFATA
jgi:hypothetical protein